MAKAFPRFDGAEHWKKLDAESQARMGAAVLEFLAGGYHEPDFFCGQELTPAERACQRAAEVALDRLQETFAANIPREALHDDVGDIRIPVCVGMVCHSCGCSDMDSCAGGCTWVTDELCSTCAISIKPAGGTA